MTKFLDNKIGSKALSKTVLGFDPPFLDAEICRFLLSRLAGYSLYVPPPKTFGPNLSLEGHNPSLEAQIPALRPKFQPRGPNSSLEAQIQVSRLKFKPSCPNSNFEAQILTQIQASRLKFKPSYPNSNFEAQILTLRPKF